MVNYPSDWAPMQLRDIGYIQMCRRIFQNQTKTYGAIPFYKISTFGDKADAYISQELYEKYKLLYPYPEKGDVLISAAGTIGKTVIFDGKDSYFQDSNIVWLKVDKEVIDRKFLWWFYRSFPWDALEGTTIQRLYNSIILDTEIHLPEKPEQEEIARTLSQFDTYIDDLEELIEKKKGIRKGALEDLVSGRTRLAGFSGEWTESKLLEHVNLVQGLTYAPENVKSSGVLVLRSSNIQNGRISLLDNVYVNVNVPEEKMIQPGDILVCVRNGSSALIGKSCILPRLNNTTFGAFMSVLRGDKTGFFAKLFESDIVQEQVRGRSNATINQITKKDFQSIIVTVPPEPEQKAIASTLNAMDEEIEALETERDKMIQIREGVMDDLLTGRIRLTK